MSSRMDKAPKTAPKSKRKKRQPATRSNAKTKRSASTQDFVETPANQGTCVPPLLSHTSTAHLAPLMARVKEPDNKQRQLCTDDHSSMRITKKKNKRPNPATGLKKRKRQSTKARKLTSTEIDRLRPLLGAWVNEN